MQAYKWQKRARAFDNNNGGAESNEFVVEKVLASRVNGEGVTEYLIRWEGYGSEDDTWEPEY